MQSSFSLVTQRGGRGHFAIVRLRAEPALGVIVTHDIQPFDPALDRFETPDLLEWTEAAARGARAFCEKLVAGGRVAGCCVVIERVTGLDVDTDDVGLACAAGLAVWKALFPLEPVPPFEWQGGRWHICVEDTHASG